MKQAQKAKHHDHIWARQTAEIDGGNANNPGTWIDGTKMKTLEHCKIRGCRTIRTERSQITGPLDLEVSHHMMSLEDLARKDAYHARTTSGE